MNPKNIEQNSPDWIADDEGLTRLDLAGTVARNEQQWKF